MATTVSIWGIAVLVSGLAERLSTSICFVWHETM